MCSRAFSEDTWPELFTFNYKRVLPYSSLCLSYLDGWWTDSLSRPVQDRQEYDRRGGQDGRRVPLTKLTQTRFYDFTLRAYLCLRDCSI